MEMFNVRKELILKENFIPSLCNTEKRTNQICFVGGRTTKYVHNFQFSFLM